ncbi:MAG TPA: 1,4-alpha-glucan branching protein GlgB [Bryobacteraceae bacterium]|nr:1,4-alpha-glucan branching protein GlgB [Bryobacteraceae bacterium]
MDSGENSSWDESDLYYFREGTHVRLSDFLGAHYVEVLSGTRFAVWAPNARRVSVIGPFNDWKKQVDSLTAAAGGVWHGFVGKAGKGSRYKFHIETSDGQGIDKADPLGFWHEQPPDNSSIVWTLDYAWEDQEWMASRRQANSLDTPQCVYEVHLGSWRKPDEPGQRWLSYAELSEQLVPYVKEMGFTHVEFMPVMEHPFYGSWGYQTTGYFSPTSRYGTPQDLMQLIDRFHQSGIGVILDWVPSHFPQDEHSLGYFDGKHEYEPADPRRGLHPDWNSFIFDYGRGEVRSFLLSSALFWLERYHADGLRVDAVASMLYLDYSRRPGEWLPNEYGGRDNLDAIGFLRRTNEDVYRLFPDVETVAEESTAWPLVSRPTYLGGLGFGLKWDMGWMHDTLQYMAEDPIHRRFKHYELTFRSKYAFDENFLLPLSHDEVVYGKRSLLGKMPGDPWQKFANLRLLYAYMYAQPGKKLLFMGDELAAWQEWDHEGFLAWDLLEKEAHAAMRLLIGTLNQLYRSERALFEREYTATSFEWIDSQDAEKNMVSFWRKGVGEIHRIAVLCNFSGVPRPNYQVGVPRPGFWSELLNTDARIFGGNGRGNFGSVESRPLPAHGQAQSITVDVPPLSALFWRLSTGGGVEHAAES